MTRTVGLSVSAAAATCATRRWPTCSIEALDAGAGVRAVLSDGVRGRVIAVYPKAFYLRFGVAVIAITDSSVEPGPIHLRCPVLPVVRRGIEVVVHSNDLVVVGVESSILVRESACIEPESTTRPAAPVAAMPTETVAAMPAEAVAAMLAGVRSPGLLAGDVQDVWPAYEEDLRAGDLRRAAEVLGGRGPGLTPAGDDVLAGLLLVASTLGHPGLEDLVDPETAVVRTNDIAAAYLYWAARGHSIAAAHDVLAGRPGALERLLRIGASSGAALAYGIGLGVRYLPEPAAIQTARAGLAPGLVQRRECSVR